MLGKLESYTFMSCYKLVSVHISVSLTNRKSLCPIKLKASLGDVLQGEASKFRVVRQSWGRTGPQHFVTGKPHPIIMMCTHHA